MTLLKKIPDPTAKADYRELSIFILPTLGIDETEINLTTMTGIRNFKEMIWEIWQNDPRFFYYGRRAAQIADRCGVGIYNTMCPVDSSVFSVPCNPELGE